MKLSHWLVGGGVAVGILLLARKASASVRAGEPRPGNSWIDWPVPSYSRKTSSYGCRPNIPGISFAPTSMCPSGQNWHTGADLAAPRRTPVTAAMGGRVDTNSYDKVNGNLVCVNHGEGWRTCYAHNDDVFVDEGDVVARGQLIAAMGSTGASTGSHVHFMVISGGTRLDPEAVIGRW